MSKSKRAAQGQASPAPAGDGKTRTDEKGRLRTSWLLAVSLFGYALVALATRYGLIRAFAALFGAWGIDGTNVHSAPAWARTLYVWHGSMATLAFAGLAVLLVGWLRKLWRLEEPALGRPSGGLWKATLVGILGPLIVAALCLIPDSVRPEWPLTAPRFTWTLPVMAVVSLISTVAGEAFTKRVLYDGLRARWNRDAAVVAVCVVFCLTGVIGGSVIGAVNLVLLGWALCALYARYGFWTAVGFQWGWSLANVFLLGFGGGETVVYRLYSVSETLLTGGDAGPMHGLWATLLLLTLAIMLSRKRHGAA